MSSAGLACKAVAKCSEEGRHHGVATAGIGDDGMQAAWTADHAGPVDDGGHVDDAAAHQRRTDIGPDQVDAVDAVLQRQDACLRAEQGTERACRRRRVAQLDGEHGEVGRATAGQLGRIGAGLHLE